MPHFRATGHLDHQVLSRRPRALVGPATTSIVGGKQPFVFEIQQRLQIAVCLENNMAAMAAGTPGCVISHDSRTDELAGAMGLPRLDWASVQVAGDTSAVLEAIFFDAAQFDRTRTEKRVTYTRKLSSLGLNTEVTAA